MVAAPAHRSDLVDSTQARGRSAPPQLDAGTRLAAAELHAAARRRRHRGGEPGRPRPRSRSRLHAGELPAGRERPPCYLERREQLDPAPVPGGARDLAEPLQRLPKRRALRRPRRQGDALRLVALAQPAHGAARARAGPASGLYFARIETDDGRVGFAPFVLLPRPFGEHRIAVVFPTNTWEAYNHRDVDGNGIGDTWYANNAIPRIDVTRRRSCTGASRPASAVTRPASCAGSTARTSTSTSSPTASSTGSRPVASTPGTTSWSSSDITSTRPRTSTTSRLGTGTSAAT